MTLARGCNSAEHESVSDREAWGQEGVGALFVGVGGAQIPALKQPGDSFIS